MLRFVGGGPAALLPDLFRAFTSSRMLRTLERRVNNLLRVVAEQRLTRELIQTQIVVPIEKMLDKEKRHGTVVDYDLEPDLDEAKLATGELDLRLVVWPAGLAGPVPVSVHAPRRDSP